MFQQPPGYAPGFAQGQDNQQKSGPPPPGAPNGINVDSFNDDTIKEHLKSRGLSTDGARPQLVQRLKDEVNKAWTQYYAKSQTGGFNQFGAPGGFNQNFGGNYQQARKVGGKFPNPNQAGGPKKKRRTRTKPKLTEEERLKREERLKIEGIEIEKRREAKRLRKEEHKRRETEAKERKRLKKIAAAEKQKMMEVEQRKLKEKRQRSEVFVYFDMKTFGDQLVKKLDPRGRHILSCQYDLSQKGFRVRFSEPEHAERCSKGAKNKAFDSMNPRTVEVPNELVILPSPIESHCVFFLDPCNPGHPHKDQSFAWVHSQGVDSKSSDTRALNLWKETAMQKYAEFGSIANVYRERGFIVVQFNAAESASAMLNDLWVEPHDCTGKINEVPIVYMKAGTPKKRDRQDCDTKYPKIKVPKKKKAPKVAETMKVEN